MYNIFDYLTWRGDIPFSADPFNEVDNMILAELAYTDFEGVPKRGAMSLAQARRVFFLRHKREEFTDSASYPAKSAALLDAAGKCPRFADIALRYRINEIDREKGSQISAVTFVLGDGTAYVAFRGTDNTLAGWKEDFDISYLRETEGQRRAVEYLNEVGRKIDLPLRVGGHSKGGNFAVYAAAFCHEPLRERIIEVYTNDGPGFRKEITQSEEYKRLLPKIISIVPDTSVVGMLLSSSCKHKVVKSSAVPGFQHDGTTWSVVRNRFERTKKSDLGKFIEKALGGWLESMDYETRKSFTYTLFSLIESTGRDTIDEITEQKIKRAEAIISAMAGMPKKKRGELLRLLCDLIRAGRQTAVSMIADKSKR
ncbi:MAG: DUF2974 domain-containing protein [Abditibacteriota bacterium]|nr:DUF2974 domain-containing protein [Abditibacteriota bacterium]